MARMAEAHCCRFDSIHGVGAVVLLLAAGEGVASDCL